MVEVCRDQWLKYVGISVEVCRDQWLKYVGISG